MTNKQQAEELRLQGNECMDAENYADAIKHYTAAIKCDPRDHLLYSNRSLAYFKSRQYYFALQDADITIAVNPRWPKGYYRRGEVEFATGNFTNALLSYQLAFLLQPDDLALIQACERAKCAFDAFVKREKRDPWLFCGIGLIFGAAIALADWTLAPSPSLKHPVLIVLLTLATSLCGFGAGKAYRFFLKTQRDGMLQMPADAQHVQDDQVSEKKSSTDKKAEKPHVKHHYSKAAARRRYQLGKSDR